MTLSLSSFAQQIARNSRFIVAGAVIATGIITLNNFSSARGADAIVPPTAPACGTGNSWTVVKLNRGISSLSELAGSEANRIQNSFVASDLSSSLGRKVDITSTITPMTGNGILNLGKFVSWDGYEKRVDSPESEQSNEQWLVEITDGAGTVTLTNFTPDLEDGTVNGLKTGTFNKNVPVVNGVKQVVLRHYNDDGFDHPVNGVYNSVVPAAFCYEFETPDLTCSTLGVEKLSFKNYRFATVTTTQGGVSQDDLSYSYSFGDGKTLNTTNAVVDHTYAQPGTYTVTVTVSADEFDLVSDCTAQITIVEPKVTCESLKFKLIKDQTYSFTVKPVVVGDIPAEQISKTFSFGDGSADVTTINETVEHTFSKAGNYTIKATLTSKGLTPSVCSVELTVPEPPALTCEAVTLTKIADKKYKITVSTKLVGGVKAEDVSYSYNFGDNSTLKTTLSSVEHSYAQSGNYTIAVTVSADKYALSKACSASLVIPKDPQVLAVSKLAETGTGSTGAGIVAGAAVVVVAMLLGVGSLQTRRSETKAQEYFDSISL